MATPATVGARELKARLGRYLRRVRQGETLVITDRGEPAAELRPISDKDSLGDPRLQRLFVLGIVRRPDRRQLVKFQPVRAVGKPTAAAIAEDRSDRF